MLLVICAEEDEAKNIITHNRNVYVHITGAGLYNILKSKKINTTNDDIILNVGYCGSNVFKPGEVYSVNSCERLNPSKTIKEEKQYLYPFYFLGADCYTADEFIEGTTRKLPLIDMELYYLSLLYPGIRSIKIVSDNLNYSEYKKADFKESWELVNKAIESLLNE